MSGNAPDYSQKASWYKLPNVTKDIDTFYIFAIVDGVETIVTGVCLDATYGYAMPEGDSIIIIGMEYAAFALGFWIYIYRKEKEGLQPVHQTQRAPRARRAFR